MKGVVLAGGLGTRLLSLTRITNKHLLPIYDRPMIFYPIQTLVEAGISDIQIVTGGNNAGDFLRLLGNGEEFGLRHLNYTYQRGEGGIAEALGLCEHFAGGEPIVVILGDNIVERSIHPFVRRFAFKSRDNASISRRWASIGLVATDEWPSFASSAANTWLYVRRFATTITLL